MCSETQTLPPNHTACSYCSSPSASLYHLYMRGRDVAGIQAAWSFCCCSSKQYGTAGLRYIHILLFLHTFFWRTEIPPFAPCTRAEQSTRRAVGKRIVFVGNWPGASGRLHPPKRRCPQSETILRIPLYTKYTEYWVVFLFFCFFRLPRFRRGRSWFISFFRDQESLCPETMNSG